MTLSSIMGEDGAVQLLRWNIPAGGPPRLSSMRQAITRAVPDWDEDKVVDVKLICTELVTNVSRHARTGGELRIIQLADGVISIEADDYSPRPPLVTSGPPHRWRCRGWDIVDALAKQWGVRPGRYGKTVWVELDVPR